MASRIAGITVEIGGDTTKLSKALEGVNKNIKNTQTQLKDVNKLLKLDPSNTELVTQKQKLLAEAIASTKTKLDTLKTAATQANEQLQKGEITQEQYDALQREIIECEESLKSLESQASKTNATLAKIDAVGTKFQEVGGKIEGVGKKIMPLSTAVTALGVAAVKTTSDFDTGMSRVAAISGATEEELARLRDTAKDLGATTAFSASEAAEGMENLASAGFTVDEIIAAMPGLLDLAASSGTDLATASDIAASALRGFGLDASEAGHVADVLAENAARTNAAVEDTGEAMKYIAPLANTMGISLEETAAAIGIMANAGIKGSQAGTTLRGTLSRLTKPTEAMQNVMDDLGISFYDSEGKMKSLSEMIGMLKNSMAGLTEEEQQYALTTLFGTNALSGMMVLMNAGEEELASLTAAYEECDGAAAKMADTMMDNLGGDIEELGGAVETLAISIGEILIPVIRDIIKSVQGFVDKLNALDDSQKELIVKIGLVVAALGPLLVIIGKTISTVGSAMKGFSSLAKGIGALSTKVGGASGVLGKLGAVLGGISAPVLAVVAVIGTLVAAFTTLWKTNEEFRTAITGIWSDIVSKVQGFCQGIVERINSLGFEFENITEVLKAIWTGFCDLLAPYFIGVFTYISDTLGTVLDVILGIVDVFISVFKGDWEGAWNAVKGIFESVWNGIVSWITNILNTLKGIFDVFLGWFGTDWNTVWTSVKTFFEGVWNGICTFFTNIGNTIKNTATTVWTAISSFFTTIWTGIKTFFESIWNGISSFFTGAVNGIKNTATSVWTAISTFFTTVLTGIQTTFSTVWNAIKTAVTTVMSAIQNVITTVWNAIYTTIEPLLSAFQYDSSTFTGWSGPIGAAQKFNTLIFEIINRDTNPGYLETIRCVVSVFDKNGTVLADETRTGFHIAPGERCKVEFPLSTPIDNAEGAALYAGFTCDRWITVVYGSTGINLNAPDYGNVCYTSGTNDPPTLNTRPISAWADLYDPNLTNKSKPVLYTACYKDQLLLTEQHLKQVDEHISPRLTAMESSLKEQEKENAKVSKSVEAVLEAFPEQSVVTELEDLLPIKSEKLNYNTSTFTGWGAPIGPVKHFNALRFSVLNREENTGDITTIRCVVSVFDKSGEILADKTLTDFHIAPGEKADVLFPLDVMIENESGAQIYAGFACDRHIGVYVGSSGVNLNPPDYGKVTYLAVSGEAPYSVTKELSRWTNIHDPNLTNKTKCNIRPALALQVRLLGENQVTQVERIVEEKMGNVPLSDMQKEQVKELAMGATEYPPRVVLPDRFLAVVGDTLQLFYRGIVEHPNPYIYNIHFKCAIGKNTPRYFEVTPTAEQVGKHTLTVEVRNHLDILLTSASTVLEVVKVADAPTAEKTFLCIGDSLTSGGHWPAEAHRRLTGEDGTPVGHGLGNIRFIGTKKRGTAGYEGYGGWTWASYLAAPSETTSDMWVYADHDKDSSDQHSIWKDENGNLWQMETIEENRIKFTRYNGHTADMPVGDGVLHHYESATHTAGILFTATAVADKNPFWDTDTDEVNFKSYCERNGFAGIDYVYTLLTWNGLTGYQAEADSAHIAKHVENAKTLLRMLHRDYPNARVGLMGIQIPSLNGGTGANYGANGGYSNAYSLVRTVMGMNLAYQAMANEEEFAPYVEFIHVSGQFDSENNMPTVSKPVNIRSTITEKVGSNGVHPTVDGYMQIADAAYRHMVAELNR